MGYVLLTVVNSLMTIVGMVLVDRSGREFLLVLGTSGIIVSLVAVGVMFRVAPRKRRDVAG